MAVIKGHYYVVAKYVTNLTAPAARLCIYSYDKSESDAGSPQLALQTHLISRGTLYRVCTYVLRTKTYVL